jgi:Major Facilitator Superfamily.
MLALALVLLVSETTGSYAFAGALSAAFAVTAALASILTSRWADRSGQTQVLRILAVVHSALLVAVTYLIVQGAPAAVQLVVVVAAGASSPAIGSFVRARWTHAAHSGQQPALLRVGFAWESILDELIFTLGPLITTALAFGVGFPVPLIVAAAAVLIGALGLSMCTRSTPQTPPGSPRAIVDPRRRANAWAVGTDRLGTGVGHALRRLGRRRRRLHRRPRQRIDGRGAPGLLRCRLHGRRNRVRDPRLARSVA